MRRDFDLDRGSPLVICTGTDPSSGLGGISVALRAFHRAMLIAGFSVAAYSTHHPVRFGGKWLWWLRAIPNIISEIVRSKRLAIPVTVYSHTGAGVSFLREGIIQCIARILGANTVMHIHAPEMDRYLRSPVQRLILRTCLLGSKTVCVLTPWWKDRLSVLGGDRHIAVVPNPMPEEWESLAKINDVRGAKNGAITVLAMARLEPGKGIDLAVRSMSFLPQSFRLVVAGSGSQGDELSRLSRGLELGDRVKLVGWVGGDKKQALLNDADIFCLPTRYDAMPMSILEAMAHGLPVVALNWGPIGDLVPNGKVGLLVEDAGPEAVAQALRALSDPAVRESYGIAGRRWVLENYSCHRVGEMLSEIFIGNAKA